MHRLWLVAKHEYLKIARRRSFVLATLGIPLFLVAIMAISIVTALGSRDERPLGYVDHSGLLAAGIQPQPREDRPRAELRAFLDEAAAQAALEAESIQAFVVVPEDYLESRAVELFYWEQSPDDSIESDFAAFVRANLAADLPPPARTRVLEGTEITLRSADGSRELRSDEFGNFLLPMLVGLLFTFAVFSSAGYLLQAMTAEKENRTMEIMITSLTPEQLIAGKALGLIAVALTQLLIWAAAAGATLAVGSPYIEFLQTLEAPGSFLLVSLAFFFPAYVLIAAMMIAVGGVVTETQQGQQIAGLLNLLFTLPYFFIVLIFSTPDSPLLVALTLFPTTSFITITLRWGSTLIPDWQLILAWVLLVASAGLSLAAAARIMRLGMLRYGQRLELRSVIQAVRARAH
ncbi:MAG TPA: ABC transporter permease [Anaerolineae bacterium]|nr:ABC transporter permease [Anaerolineae bacterium]